MTSSFCNKVSFKMKFLHTYTKMTSIKTIFLNVRPPEAVIIYCCHKSTKWRRFCTFCNWGTHDHKESWNGQHKPLSHVLRCMLCIYIYMLEPENFPRESPACGQLRNLVGPCLMHTPTNMRSIVKCFFTTVQLYFLSWWFI